MRLFWRRQWNELVWLNNNCSCSASLKSTCLLLLLLKTAAQAKVGKTILFIICFRNPTSTCSSEYWRKHNSEKHPKVDFSLKPIQGSGVKYSVEKDIQHSKLGRQETPCKIRRTAPWFLKLQWLSCGRCSGMPNSGSSRRKLVEQTVILVRINLVQHT